MVVADLLPHLASLATDCHVPILVAAAEGDEFHGVPKILPEARVPEESPVFIFAS
jgi:hypothetical protein